MDDTWRLIIGAAVAVAIIGLVLFAAGTPSHQRSEAGPPAVAQQGT